MMAKLLIAALVAAPIVAIQAPPKEAAPADPVGLHASKGWGEEQDKEMIRPFDPKASWHPTYGDLSYNHDGFTTDWHTEWRQGDFPTWKDMHPQAKWAEERQSDGIPSPPGR